MPKDLPNDEEEPREVPSARGAATEEAGDDAEGHFLLPDTGAARILAARRSRDVDRQVRDRQRQKEARPNNKNQR